PMGRRSSRAVALAVLGATTTFVPAPASGSVWVCSAVVVGAAAVVVPAAGGSLWLEDEPPQPASASRAHATRSLEPMRRGYSAVVKKPRWSSTGSWFAGRRDGSSPTRSTLPPCVHTPPPVDRPSRRAIWPSATPRA